MSKGKIQRLPIRGAFFLLLIPALLSACGPAVSITTSLPVVANSSFIPSGEWTDHSSGSQIDPPSNYCFRVGGTVTIHTRGDGHIYKLCQFTDNRACEVWALFRGDCPVGGVRITGLDTIAQYYCVWLGGETLAGGGEHAARYHH